MKSTLNLQIDGQKIEAKSGQTILEAALNAGIYIPHLCHHPILKPQGGCKVCSVEVEGLDKTITSCNTPVEDNMVVHTKTENVTRIRNLAVELMLASHPLDCTSCSVYLNCEFQNLLQYLGVVHSRMHHYTKSNNYIASAGENPLIKREMERCIQCGRCVRACEELRGVGVLEYKSLNGESYVGVKDDVTLNKSDCRFCSACVEVCPTGAIQDMPGIFPLGVSRDKSLIPCKNACPAHTDIPKYVRLVEQERYSEAVSVIREKLTFPHVLGLVCTHKCESDCKRKHLNDSISIREIKRFAVENDKDMIWKDKVVKKSPTGKRLSIVGAGPAGLTAAWHLSLLGHSVTVFEQNKKAGGMMQYGIPEYRLNREIVQNEIDIIRDIGVSIKTDIKIESINSLRKEYDAVLVAVGAQKGSRPHIDVEGCNNVWAGVEFCHMASTENLPELGNIVTVIGGGNVAFDCARLAKKAHVDKVRIICLESRTNMLADEEEIQEALEAGIEIYNSTTCTQTIKNDGRLTSLKTVQLRSFSFGPNGLEMDIEPDSLQQFETDSLIIATGQSIDLNEDFGLELGRSNTVTVNENMQSSQEGVFAVGDCVTNTRSIVEAIASATRIASEIDKYLGGTGNIDVNYSKLEEPNPKIGIIEEFSSLPRNKHICAKNDALDESKRCLQCDLRLQIPRVKFWGDPAYKKNRKGR